jgi:gas vesicle protein
MMEATFLFGLVVGVVIGFVCSAAWFLPED